MTQSYIVSPKHRTSLQKLCAGLLMLSINLTAGIGTLFISAEVAYAADSGFKSPTSAVSPNEWSNPTKAFSSNNDYATEASDGDDQGYKNFGFTVPAGSTINGVEVNLEAFSTLGVVTSVTTLDPISIGNFNDWTQGAGTKVDAVDSNGGSYIEEATIGESQTFLVENAGIPAGATINSVTLKVDAKKVGTSGADPKMKLRIEKGTGPSNISDGTEITLSSSGDTVFDRVMTTNPFTGSAWTISEVNAWSTKFGVVRTSATGGRTPRVDQITVEVSYSYSPVTSGCEIEVRIGDAGTFSSYKTAVLTDVETTHTLGGASDLWSGVTWSDTVFSNANFRLEVQFDDTPSCDNSALAYLDHIQAKVHYTPPQENTLQRCTDTIDNDGDASADFADSDCASFKPTITVTKVVSGGTKQVSDFSLYVQDGDALTPMVSGVSQSFNPGSYIIGEMADENYSASYDGSCGPNASFNYVAGQAYQCTITNTFIGSQCEDGLDNDEDGQIDYPLDAGCTEANDNSEVNVAPPPPSCEADTSTMTRVSGIDGLHVGNVEGPAPVLVDFDTELVGLQLHSAWTASIPGAQWVWGENPIASPQQDQVESFFDVFYVVGTPTGGTLAVAADNTYEVYLNGTKIGESTGGLNGTDGNNFQSGTQDVIPTEMLALHLVSGQNTLEFRVRNIAQEDGNAQSNPAGLMYKLTVNKNACEPTPAPVCDPEVNLIENSGFEAPEVSAGTYSIIPDSNTSLKWLVNWVSAQVTGTLGLEIQNNVAGTPYAGANLAELDGDHPVTIWQTPSTVVGQEYELTFAHSPRPGTTVTDNTMSVLLNGDSFLTIASEQLGASDTSWQTYSKKFTADSATTKVEFKDTGLDNSLGNYLDNVALRCVPSDVFENTYETCTDSTDNDGDTLTDLADDDCVNFRPTIKVEKVLVNDNGGTKSLSDFSYHWTLGALEGSFTVPEADTALHGVRELTYEMAGAYVVTETPVSGYTTTYSEGCSGTIEVGQYLTCVITNNDNSGGGDGETPENTPEACTDEVDNDGDEAVDGADSDCTPKLTVTKVVVNDNGGGKQASDFTLHVNVLVDVCANLSGLQESVPSGMIQSGQSCIPDEEEFIQDALNTISDWLTPRVAYAIELLYAPATFSGNSEGTDMYFEGPSYYSVSEDADAGYTTTYGEGCSGYIGLGEEKTCVVTNDDIAQGGGGGGGGSTVFDYWGCTNPSATNFNSLANKDDGSCHLPGGSGGAGGDGSGGGNPPGEVLGAATVEPELPLPPGCSAYITTYMKLGKKNDTEDVKRLQAFLNENMSANLPMSGYFGSMTKSWVKKFQKLHHSAIIQPWIDAGYKGNDIKEGTGVVYKTTKRAINLMKCATLDEPMPNLSGDPGLE